MTRINGLCPERKPAMITSAELRFAQLKLAAFAALAGWGTPGEPVKIGEREFETTKPHSFERHTQLADRLVLWAHASRKT
jgi:hypothetical protein